VRVVALVTVLVACGRFGFDAAPLSGDAPRSSDARITDATAIAPAFVQYADTTSGNLLVVAIGYELSPLPDLDTVADTSADAFTVLPPVESTAGFAREYVAYAIASSSGTTAVHVKLTSSASYLVLRVHEYTNVGTVESYESNIGDATGSDAMTVAIATAVPNELVFAYAVSTAGQATAGTGFTPRSTTAGDTTEDRLEPGSGAQLVTASTNDTGWSLQAVSIRGQ
jgi:hypothetical protein